MTSVPIGKPWQMIAIDILEVPLLYNNNRYLLVVQDYFTKWVEAIPIPDQTAQCIVSELLKLFSTMGVPEIVHSDQGRNFESALLRHTLEVFGASKSHTTAYHPQGDGMVERFNRTLLQMLHSYVDTKEDWEKYLPLVHYAYRTAVHSSTGTSPFNLMYGRAPKTTAFEQNRAFAPSSYQAHLSAKLAEMNDFVNSNLAEATTRQKRSYDKVTATREFKAGNYVWLSIPTARKLDPQWDGRWTVKAVKSPLNMEITDGKNCKVVHVNRLRPRIQPNGHDVLLQSDKTASWTPPTIDHFIDCSPDSSAVRRYPLRVRRPPLRYIESNT